MPVGGAGIARPGALLVALIATLLVALPSGPAGAAPRPDLAGPDVRLVVRTESGDTAAMTRAAVAAVTRAAVAAGATRTGAVRRLRSVSFAVPPARVGRVRSLLGRRADVASVDIARERFLTAEPDDTRYGEQHGYLTAMGVTAAWERGALGSPAVRVAVVDSGVDVTHPDLAGKIAGTYNAVDRSADVRDLVGHGTGTASVAVAATGNGLGMAGAGRDSSLLAVKVADVTGRIFTDDLAAGIVWAVDNGADVLNLSLGGPFSDRLERAAVAYARSRDVLVVASAGNAGTSRRQFPAALPGVLSVGATTADGSVRAPFSGYGAWVDVAAPGRSILVAAPGGGYDVGDGTSYSAPLVAGAVGLLEAARPGRSATDLAQAVVGGTDNARLGFAHGLVHIDRSLDLLAPTSAPILTSPSAGRTVGGVLAVTVTSSAAQVRLDFGGVTRTVPVSAGAAAATFETFGLAGQVTVSARDCSATGQCHDAAATTTVTIDNPAPTLTSPVTGQDLRGDRVTVSAAAPPGAAVRFLLDNGARGSVLDTTAPHGAGLFTEGLGDGAHTVRALLCRSDGAVCDQTRPGEVPVTVARLHPAITSLSPRAISPDGDGRRDRTTLTYLLDRAQSPTLQVRNPAGEVVYRRELGRRGAGSHTATWDGRRRRGAPVTDGTFVLAVVTAEGALAGRATSTVTVDRSRPALRGARVSSRRVLPVRDRYLDAVTVSAGADEDLRRLRLEVATRSGATVRTVRGGGSTGEPVGVVWDGRRAGGRLAPGTYRVRLVAEDLAGNRTRSAPRTVTVSGQRLVRRSGSTTVRADRTLSEVYADECSAVFRRDSARHRSWVAYAASATCVTGDAFAAADHQVLLPAAARFGTVRLSAYGGRGDRRYRDSAKAVYYDGLQNLSPHLLRLGPSVGTWTGPRVPAGPLLIRSRVFRWQTITTGIAWYDVASYRVDYTYFVLR